MQHFVPVCDVDVAEALRVLEENSGMWKDHTARQDHPLSPHPDTETIYLRAPVPLDETTFQACVPEAEYPAWDLEPLRTIAETVRSRVGGRLARVMVIKLKPGGCIKTHIDQGQYAEATERFHVPLMTNEKAFLRAFAWGKGWISHRSIPGQAFWFNKDAWHGGFNGGTTDRIHMIVDIYPC